MFISEEEKDKNCVSLMATMFDEMRLSSDQRSKPIDHSRPIVYYDHIKGVADIINLLSYMVSTRSKNQWWPVNANIFVLDIVRSNARTVYNECNKLTFTNFEFAWELGKELAM